MIKVALNSDAGTVLDAATLSAILTAARGHGLPVVAHAEGSGMARIAIEAGVDALAHTPFTELLDPGLIAAAVGGGQRWISTLDIHRGDRDGDQTARTNLARFLSAGGVVLYGTDLGDDDLPVGVNARELAALHQAGLQGTDLLDALTDPWPRAERSQGVATFVPGAPPADVDAIPAWLGGATVVPTEELISDDHG